MNTLKLIKGSGLTSVATVQFSNEYTRYVNPKKYAYVIEHDEHGDIEVSVGDYAIVNSPSSGYTMVKVVGLEADIPNGSLATKPILKFISTRRLDEYEKRRCKRIDQQKAIAHVRDLLKKKEEQFIEEKAKENLRRIFNEEMGKDPTIVQLRDKLNALENNSGQDNLWHLGSETSASVSTAKEMPNSRVRGDNLHEYLFRNQGKPKFIRAFEARQQLGITLDTFAKIAVEDNLEEAMTILDVLLRLRLGSNIVNNAPLIANALFPFIVFRSEWNNIGFHETVMLVEFCLRKDTNNSGFAATVAKILVNEFSFAE